MNLPTTKEIIARLKAEKLKRDLSIPQLQKMCEDAGVFISINTLRNIFAKDAESGSFSYERTLRPLANVLVPKLCEERTQSGEARILKKQLELLTNQLVSEREAHKKHINFLTEQVRYQIKTIEEKDKLIIELLKEVSK